MQSEEASYKEKKKQNEKRNPMVAFMCDLYHTFIVHLKSPVLDDFFLKCRILTFTIQLLRRDQWLEKRFRCPPSPGSLACPLKKVGSNVIWSLIVQL